MNMHKIGRAEFLKMSALGMAASVTPMSVWKSIKEDTSVKDEMLFKRLLKNNDLSVARYLSSNNVDSRWGRDDRSMSEEFAIHTASYCQPDSKYYRSKDLLNRLEHIILTLLQSQYPNGTLDSWGNRQSPPDTAFLMDHLCPSALALNRQEFTELSKVREDLKRFLLSAGEGLRTGGVHTSNHRWEVSSALARLYAIFHDEKYVRRIDEWQAEGVDINEDGQFSERSRNYAVVMDASLLTIGRILNRPALFESVKKNLEATYYYMEANGDLVTLDSRRQDQYESYSATSYESLSIRSYYLFYRYLAIYYGDEALAAIANEIETFPDFERVVLSQSLIFFMENPLLLNEVKTNKRTQHDYSKHFALSSLARIRREQISASIFGGNDKPVIIASGRSNNPTFFSFRKGSAILDYARLSTSFFNTGYFRSDGLVKEGNRYILHETKEAYYFQPMPANMRNDRGDYKLSESLDGRFWSKMDFASRPTTALKLDTVIRIEEDNGSFKMDFEATGAKGVEVTLELCFRPGGALQGVASAFNKEDYFLKEGYATYTFGNDVIKFGPGKTEHNDIFYLDGEVYSSHFGTIKGKGMHVYITGLVPFMHSMTIT